MPLSQSTLPILLARIDGTQVGFSAAAVSEIVRAVAIAPLAGAPGVIEGAINLHGRIVPVVDVRRRLALPALPVAASQFLIILETKDRLIAVRVDDVEDVTEIPSSSLEAPAALSAVLQRLQGIAATESGALVIYDVETFLTQAERELLDGVEMVEG
ncbi:MAG: chemotaxis protein CheW [bacterium]